MKKLMIVTVVLAMVGVGYARQATPPRTALLNRGLNRIRPASALPPEISAEKAKFWQENPTGTNEFGRTWKVQCAYEKFMKENPDGKNKFGKTFDVQWQYEQAFVLGSFLEFKFGEHCSKYTNECNPGESKPGILCRHFNNVKLSKPYKIFQTTTLRATSQYRLFGVWLSNNEVCSYDIATNVVVELVASLEKQYMISILKDDQVTGGLRYVFRNDTVVIEVRANKIGKSSKGDVSVRVENWGISREETFNRKYPTGTNELGRTFLEQYRIDEEARDREERERFGCNKKYAKLKIDGLAGFKFGEVQKDFSFKKNEESCQDNIYVELDNPIRYFKTAALSYTSIERRMKEITLIADARGVSLADLKKETEAVKAIVEKKYGVELKLETNTRTHQDEYVLMFDKYWVILGPGNFKTPSLKLTVIDRGIEDTMTTKWDMPPEKDADRL